ncbi:hypothetical protein AB1L42_19330 [Thalassoglobus sp. JC818]|uniref:hypothetical protein n=1 Tax=Thalassoglobus sp. JC818 TaxID=3232136 RepID=UPI003457B0C9
MATSIQATETVQGDHTEHCDSVLTIVNLHSSETGEKFVPNSHYGVPAHQSFRTRRHFAEQLCLELNRDLIKQAKRGIWFLVIYARGGFRVVRIPTCSTFIPRDEYDLPFDASKRVGNTEARRRIKEFNNSMIQRSKSTGELIDSWMLHVKPLRRPEETHAERFTDDQRTALKAIRQYIDLSVEPAPMGDDIIFWFKAGVHSSGKEWGTRQTAQGLRNIASQFLKAASQLDGAEEITLDRINPCGHEFGIRGHDEDVCLRVYNTDDPEQAKQQALKVLGLIQNR